MVHFITTASCRLLADSQITKICKCSGKKVLSQEMWVEELVIIVKISVFLFLEILFNGILLNSSEQEAMVREVVTCPG